MRGCMIEALYIATVDVAEDLSLGWLCDLICAVPPTFSMAAPGADRPWRFRVQGLG